MKNYSYDLNIVWENFELGGVTTHLVTLLNQKNFINKKIHILTNKDNAAIKNLKSSLINQNVKITKFKNLNCIFFDNIIFKLLYNALRPILFFFSIIQFYNLLKKFKKTPMLANCGGYGNFRSEMAAIIASKLRGNNQNFLLIHHSFFKPRLWNFLIQIINYFIYRIIIRLIFVSEASKTNILKNVLFFKNKKKNLVIYNGLEEKPLKKKFLQIFKTKKKLLKIGVLSRVEKIKGHEQIISSVEKMSELNRSKIKIYFIGSGKKSYVEYLKRKIKSINLSENFKFCGYLREESNLILSHFDLTLSMNQDFEGFGYSHVEALSLNIPSFVSNVGAAEEIFGGKNILLLEKNDDLVLKKKIEEFIRDSSNFKKETKKIRSRIKKKFNAKLMSDKFFSILIE